MSYRDSRRWTAKGRLAAASLTLLLIVACGADGASHDDEVVPLKKLSAEVCTEGKARGAKLYVRNLDDFEWRGITLNVVKSGETYSREWSGLRPQSDHPAEPFTDSTEFFVLGTVVSQAVSRGTGVPGMKRLHNFSSLESARIEITAPHPGEWTGDVAPCS